MMDSPGMGTGILGRVGERVLSWIALALIVAGGVAIWQMGPAARGAIWSGIWRTTAWVVFAAAVPWASRLVIRRVMEAGTNWAAVALLGALLVLDIVAALVLMTAWPSGGWGWMACLGALALVGTYNYLVTEYLAQTAGG